MAFDENGPTDIENRVAICERAYRLLTEKAEFPPEDIIFDEYPHSSYWNGGA